MPAFNSPFIAPQPFHIAIPQLQTSQGAQWVPRFRKHHQNELSSHDCNTNGHKVSRVWTTHDDIVTPNWKHFNVCNKWDMSPYYQLLFAAVDLFLTCAKVFVEHLVQFSQHVSRFKYHNTSPLKFFFQDFQGVPDTIIEIQGNHGSTSIRGVKLLSARQPASPKTTPTVLDSTSLRILQ